MSSFRTIVLIVLPIIVGVGIIQYNNHHYFTAESPPPLDFGNGNMFDQIAQRYDVINRILAIGMDISWRQRMVQIIVDRILPTELEDTATSNMQIDDASTATTKYIVDFATGTADVALLLAKEIQKRTIKASNEKDKSITNVHIIGIDPSEQMISIGRRKVQQQQQHKASAAINVPKIDLHISDVQDLTDVKRQSVVLYDAATMAFGIRNVPNRTQAFCEIHTTLKTNATLCILEFNEPSYPMDGIIGGIIVKYFIKYIIPFVGGILSGGHSKEYWHLQNSIKDFPTPPIAFSQSVTSSQLQCHNYYENDDDSSSSSTTPIHGPLYQLDDIIPMNFGSVQLYVFRTLPVPTSAATNHG